MFEPIPGLPDGVIGYEAVGQIEAADYDKTLIPGIAEHGGSRSIRVVIVLGERFTGFTRGAMRADAGVVLHGGAWERTALVSDLSWVAHLAMLFGWMVPGQFRQFALAERDAAIEWAAGG